MVEQNVLLIAAAVLLMAALYSTVGHGGVPGILQFLRLRPLLQNKCDQRHYC